jgi:hypothetical protein
MGTTDLTASTAIPWDGLEKRFQMYSEFDIGVLECENSDVVSLFDIPAGVKVHGVTIEVTRQAVVATSMVIAVGITGGTTNGFDASADMEAAAGTLYHSTPSDTYPAAGGFVSASDTVLALVFTTVGAITTAPKLKVWVDCEFLKEIE